MPDFTFFSIQVVCCQAILLGNFQCQGVLTWIIVGLGSYGLAKCGWVLLFFSLPNFFSFLSVSVS